MAIKDKAIQRLNQSLRSRKIHGFPLNVAYTDADDICDRVKASAVHETQHPEVQFIVAVRVVPYVNNVLSVWIFIGTMETQAGALGGMTNDYSGVNTFNSSGLTSPQTPSRRRAPRRQTAIM
jgi:hypothetical protein